MIKIKIFGTIGPETANVMESAISSLKDENEKILLVIKSDGGSLDDGFAAIDMLKGLKNPIYTVCYSMCASMACVFYSLGERRYISDHCKYLMHQPFVVGAKAVNATYAKELESILLEDLEEYKKYVLKGTEIPKNKLKIFVEKGEDLVLSAKECIKYKISTDKFVSYEKIFEDMELPEDEEIVTFDASAAPEILFGGI